MKEVSTLCLTALLLLLGKLALASTNTFFIQDTILSIEDTVSVQIQNCSGNAEICIGLDIDSLSNYQITANGMSYSNGLAECDFDTISLYPFAGLAGQGNTGPYILQDWQVNSTTYITNFNNITELVDSMNVWDPNGNWMIDNDLIAIVGGDPMNTYSDIVIWVQILGAPSILGYTPIFEGRGSLLNFPVGSTEVIVTETVSGCADTFLFQVACVNPSIVPTDLNIGESDTICLDFSELIGAPVSVFNVCGNTNANYSLFAGDSCVSITGLMIGQDTACMVACDAFGICDTTFLAANIQAPSLLGTHIIEDVVFAGFGEFWCIDQTIFPGNIDTIYNICEELDGPAVNFAIDAENYCLLYNGILSGQQDTACIVVCDDLLNCDTTTFYISVARMGPLTIYDTIFPNTNTTFCDFDLTNFQGNLDDIENGCAVNSGSFVDFTVDDINFCVSYAPVNIGKDTACIYLMDDMGTIDTTYLIVCVLEPITTYFYDTIRSNLMTTYCLDDSELGGVITSISNNCEDASGESVDFDPDILSLCVDIQTFNPGTDTACYVICDNFNVCDTTFLIITVPDEMTEVLPVAIADVDTGLVNTPLVINVCGNDTIPNDNLSNFFVLPIPNGGIGPNNGTAFDNGDCTVSYIPNTAECNFVDSFLYVICNSAGCDTTSVMVLIECESEEEFKIYNGFSPNGDGVNDFFRIDGIELFPNHKLVVYNRWGNQVLVTENYQNDWEAQWEGSDLPDGTYFYVFDDGSGEYSSGYVQISR